jgi:hypothetical protein
MNKETFLNSTLNNISQVYSGKRRCCRCGCGGIYTATTYMIDPRTDDIDNKLVERRLKRAKKLVLEGADVDYGDTYVDVETGNDRALTFYFDEVVK